MWRTPHSLVSGILVVIVIVSVRGTFKIAVDMHGQELSAFDQRGIGVCLVDLNVEDEPALLERFLSFDALRVIQCRLRGCDDRKKIPLSGRLETGVDCLYI